MLTKSCLYHPESNLNSQKVKAKSKPPEKAKIKHDQRTDTNEEYKVEKSKRKVLSKSVAKLKKQKNVESVGKVSLKNTKARLLEFINDKRSIKNIKQKTADINEKDKSKERLRKKKIGSFVNNLQNQAVSNINLHMNFYHLDNKIVPTTTNKGDGLSKQASKTNLGKLSKNKSEKKLTRDASIKKHESKKSLARYTANNIVHSIRAIKRSDVSKTRPSKKIQNYVSEKPKRQEQIIGDDNPKWSKINQLMKKLKNKLEREDPEKIKVFKNIEKILKCVKSKKKNDKDKPTSAVKTRPTEDHNADIIRNEKARLKTLHIEPPKRINSLQKTDELVEKYKFLEYLEPRPVEKHPDAEKKSILEEKDHIFIKTLELVSTNNYFFLPKKDSNDIKNVSIHDMGNYSPIKNHTNKSKYQITRANHIDFHNNMSPKETGNPGSSSRAYYFINENNFKSLNSIESKKPQTSLRVVSKPDMEVWATPSKKSLELICNELALRMSRSQIDENLNKSLRNSSLMLHVCKKKDLGRSGRLESVRNYSKEIKHINKGVAQSCYEFDDMAHKKGENPLDSLMKLSNEGTHEGKDAIKVRNGSMGKSWLNSDNIEKLLKPDDKSLEMIFRTRLKSDIGHGETNVLIKTDLDEISHNTSINDVGEQESEDNGLSNFLESVQESMFDHLCGDLLNDKIYVNFVSKRQTHLRDPMLERDQSSSLPSKLELPELYNDLELLDSQTFQLQVSKNVELLEKKKTQVISNNDLILNDAIKITDENLDDLNEDKSFIDNSEETVYAVRTHFNAINEYLYILCDYLQTNEKWKPQKLLKIQDLSNISTVDLMETSKNLHSYNRTYYEALKPFILDAENSEELYEEVENEIQQHCGILANMEDLVDLQRTFHKSIFDCFIYCFMKISIKDVIQIDKVKGPPFIYIKDSEFR